MAWYGDFLPVLIYAPTTQPRRRQRRDRYHRGYQFDAEQSVRAAHAARVLADARRVADGPVWHDGLLHRERVHRRRGRTEQLQRGLCTGGRRRVGDAV